MTVQQHHETAYQALVHPHLEYASTIWDSHHQNEIDILEKIQRKAARFVKGKYQLRESPTEMMKELKWNSLQERRLVARQTMFYKIVNNSTAVPLPTYIEKPTLRTRGQHSKSFINIRATTDSYKFSFIPRSLRCWNLLPEGLVTAPSADQFKNMLWRKIEEGSIMVKPPKDRTISLGSNSSSQGPLAVC